MPPSSELKSINRNRIYQALWRHTRLSKQQLQQQLQLSLPTVTQNLMALCAENLICEDGTFSNTGGRSAKGYAIVSDARLAMGIDINKTHVSVVIVDLRGSLVYVNHFHQHFQATKEYYQLVASLAEEAISSVRISFSTLLGIGVSVQGLVSQDRQKVTYGPILGITGFSTEEFSTVFPYPIELYHDVESAAFAELWVSPELDNGVYLSLSTNLGGALIFDREIFTGSYSAAGKLEHMTLIPDGLSCYCGGKGCAEVYCSATHLTEAIADEKLDTFFLLLAQKDLIATRRWQTYLIHLSILLNSLYMLLDTDVILGGYMAQYLTPYLNTLKESVYSQNRIFADRDYIKLARFQNEPVAAGSALRYVNNFLLNV